MSRLNLILPELAAPLAALDTATLPRLPAFELWLARAARAPLGLHWHRWLAGAAAGSPAGFSSGGVAASALGRTDARHYWLATPVHYVAGIDTLRLHPAGVLRFSDAEQASLAEDFARTFDGSGWELLATGHRDLLLAGPPQQPFDTLDPVSLLGQDPAAGWSRTQAAAPLRRLAAEVEMWLHGHALNHQREAAGQLAATGLWFWGGGAQPAALRARAPGQLWADDAFAQGLWQLLGADAQALPDDLMAAPFVAEDLTVLWPLPGDDAVGALQRLERHWLAPALQQLQRGQRATLCLVAGGCSWTLTRPKLRRFWRRSQPWWLALRAC